MLIDIKLVALVAEDQFQTIAIHHQIAQTHHHAHERRQMEELFERNGGGDRQSEQTGDDQRTRLQLDFFIFIIGDWRFIRNRKLHDRGRHDKIHYGRDEQREEIKEVSLAILPHHERGDVAKWAECTAGVCRADEVNETQGDEFGAVDPDGHHHRTDQQGGCQVICHGGQEEGDDAGDPKQLAIAETAIDEPCAEGFEHIALGHRVDVGHRHEQEQHQFGEFAQIVFKYLMDCFRRHAIGLRHPRDLCPNDARRKNHWLGFAHVGKLFGHHQGVGDDEDQHAVQAALRSRQTQNFHFFGQRHPGQC